MKQLSRVEVAEYASWFRCLADPTRLQVLHAVATADRPLTVGDVVEVIGKTQSTVSRHLQLLAQEGFVVTEPDGVKTMVRVNAACMNALPAAAAAVMGVDPPGPAR